MFLTFHLFVKLNYETSTCRKLKTFFVIFMSIIITLLLWQQTYFFFAGSSLFVPFILLMVMYFTPITFIFVVYSLRTNIYLFELRPFKFVYLRDKFFNVSWYLYFYLWHLFLNIVWTIFSTLLFVMYGHSITLWEINCVNSIWKPTFFSVSCTSQQHCFIVAIFIVLFVYLVIEFRYSCKNGSDKLYHCDL